MSSFSCLHFTWSYGSWHPQRILKKYPFWKYDSCFSSELSKLASVWNKLNLSLKYWFMEAKIDFCVCHGPQKWSEYHLDTLQSTLSQNNNCHGAILLKINFCHVWKCMISGVFRRSLFWQLWRKPAVIFSKWLFFQISLGIPWAI